MLILQRGAGRSVLLGSLAVVLLAATLATGPPALARAPQEPPSSAPAEESSADRGLTDEREVEAFLDGYVGHQLEDYDIPGATVSVVRDGRVLLARGYGEARVESEPVLADETLFRIASVSKLFAATAMMQLVEEGKLDLDENVNAYLDDVEVPDTYPGRPVTLRHLLTHTAGFEEHFTGSGARNATDVEPLGDYVATQMPARVRPPGEVAAYSNYGMSLAGYIVQEVSGVPYERYVEENILGPLGMESTTATQPPAPDLRDRLATGYDVEGGEPVARPYEYFDDAPAGSVTTTATDMARFMIAHLQNGCYAGPGGETRILEESTAKEMHEGQFASDPRLDGMAYGFYEQTVNGERTIQHGGNLRQFHANLVLLPERDVGIFVAYNSYGDGGDFAEYELADAFLDRYYPEPPPSHLEPSGEGGSGKAASLAGSYRLTRSNHTGFEKVLTLLSGASVTAGDDGSITTSGGYLSRDLESAEQRWVEVGQQLFRAEDRNEYLAFRDDGRALYLSSDADPTVAYERVPFYEAPGLHVGLLAGSLGILALTAAAWPVGAMIARRYRRRYGKPGAEQGEDTGAARRTRILAWAVCALDLVFAIGVALVFSNAVETLAIGASPSLMAILTLPLLSAALTAGVLACAVLAWKRRYWGVFGRLHYSLVAVSALTFVVLLAYYNLLGFRL